MKKRNGSRRPVNVASELRRFFKSSPIPRVEDAVLSDYVGAISMPFDWNKHYAKISRGPRRIKKKKRTQIPKAPPRLRKLKDVIDTSINCPLRGENGEPKLYLKAGLYREDKAARKRSRHFEFPLPEIEEDALKLRDFVMPYNIYCPSETKAKVPDWKPLRRSMWVNGSAGFHLKISEQRPICVCRDRGYSSCGDHCLNRMLQCECDPDSCPFGYEDCGNRAFQSLSEQLIAGRTYAMGFEVFQAGPKGFGLRAIRSYGPGELILEYTGDIISQQQMQDRQRTIYRNKHNYYFLSLEKGFVIDSGTRGSAARFVNHSCSPNCEMQKWYVRDSPKVGLFAGPERIEAGQELTYDYNFTWFEGAEAQACHCGSANCRGIIGPKNQSNNGADSASVSRENSAKPHNHEDNNEEASHNNEAEEDDAIDIPAYQYRRSLIANIKAKLISQPLAIDTKWRSIKRHTIAVPPQAKPQLLRTSTPDNGPRTKPQSLTDPRAHTKSKSITDQTKLKSLIDKPKSLTDKPERVTNKPERVTDKPKRVTDKPERVTDKPKRVIDKPKKLIDKPTKVTAKSVTGQSLTAAQKKHSEPPTRLKPQPHHTAVTRKRPASPSEPLRKERRPKRRSPQTSPIPSLTSAGSSETDHTDSSLSDHLMPVYLQSQAAK